MIPQLACWMLLAAASEPIQVDGTVRLTKAGPEVESVLVAGERTFVLSAYDPGLNEELRRLGGTRVRIRTPEVPRGETPMRVLGYQILGVSDGPLPRVGTLARMAGSRELLFVSERGIARRLPSSWSRKMGRLIGAKLWIQGEVRDGMLRPSRFRLLRSPPDRRARKRSDEGAESENGAVRRRSGPGLRPARGDER
ncbi:MAG TPA: hypothetical protein RMG48_22560 [Myxococcales bacterium LLY-WYZ-16_1]|nr:hypothetical protein [Myxococcales bacterium LLY-WYZ-16_1]